MRSAPVDQSVEETLHCDAHQRYRHRTAAWRGNCHHRHDLRSAPTIGASICKRSSGMPPNGALICPSSEVLVPKGITAARSFGAELHHLDDLRRRRGEDHRIGRLAFDPGQRVGVLLAKRVAGREAVAEALREQHPLCLRRGALDSVRHEYAHGDALPPSRFTKSEGLAPSRNCFRSRRCRPPLRSERWRRPAQNRAISRSGRVGAPRGGTPRPRYKALRQA